MAIADTPTFVGNTQVVVPNVTELNADGSGNNILYLVAQSGDNAPGLYVWSDSGWLFVSAGAVVV